MYCNSWKGKGSITNYNIKSKNCSITLIKLSIKFKKINKSVYLIKGKNLTNKTEFKLVGYYNPNTKSIDSCYNNEGGITTIYFNKNNLYYSFSSINKENRYVGNFKLSKSNYH